MPTQIKVVLWEMGFGWSEAIHESMSGRSTVSRFPRFRAKCATVDIKIRAEDNKVAWHGKISRLKLFAARGEWDFWFFLHDDGEPYFQLSSRSAELKFLRMTDSKPTTSCGHYWGALIVRNSISHYESITAIQIRCRHSRGGGVLNCY